MNAQEQSMLLYAVEKVIDATRLLRERGSVREGLPDAWYYALIRLKAADLPESVREEFKFLSNEMGRSLEARPQGGLRFAISVSGADVHRIGCAVWIIHKEIIEALLREAKSPDRSTVLSEDLIQDAVRALKYTQSLSDWNPEIGTRSN